MVDVVAVVAAVILLAIAGLHLLWAAGVPWPARDAASLGALVVGGGGDGRGRMPPPWATVAVALTLVLVAAGALAVRGLVATPAPAAVRALTWLAAGALAARGLGGFFEARWRPHVRALPYGRWNQRLYSPLCLALAAALAAALLA
jgi:hypothetical protein